MNSITLVVLIYASAGADVPETVVRVPLPGASMEVCQALGSQVEAMTAHGGKPWVMTCEKPESEGLRV